MNGSRLKELRLQRGLSQEYIAAKMYVVRQTVSNWERELSSPSADQVKNLSILLDVSPDLLLGMKDGFASVLPAISGLSEQSPPPKSNCSAVKKKEEMFFSITNYLEGMNEAGVTFWHNFIMSIPVKERWMASATQECIGELDAIAAQREQENASKERAEEKAKKIAAAKRERIYHDYTRMFNAIKNVNVPTRYDITVGEIQAIDFVCGEIRCFFPEYAYSIACKYFDYGFVKGMRYATARAKKKQK